MTKKQKQHIINLFYFLFCFVAVVKLQGKLVKADVSFDFPN